MIEKAESLELQSLIELIGNRDEIQLQFNQANQKTEALLSRYEVKSLESLAKKIKQTEDNLEKQKGEAKSFALAAEDLNKKITSQRAIAQRFEEEAKRHRRLLKEMEEECIVSGQKVTAQTIQSLIKEKIEEAEKHGQATDQLITPYSEMKGKADKLAKSSHQLESQIKQMINLLKGLGIRERNYFMDLTTPRNNISHYGHIY